MSSQKISVEEIVDIAKEAGHIAMQYYDADYDVTDKADRSPVTGADLAVHDYLTNELLSYGFPVLSEEGQSGFEHMSESSHMWVIDPLDGTKDFIQKTGEFAIMIGLVDSAGKSVCGGVYAPACDELYHARKGEGAFLTKGHTTTRLQVSDQGLEGGRILVSRNHLGDWEQQIAQKNHMEQITMGSAGLKICRIAAGAAELYINSSDKCGIWDTCAADIILQEAGGKIVTLRGDTLQYDRSHVALADGFMVSNSYCANEIQNI